MRKEDAIFALLSQTKHRLLSRHTLGHGIHSPYLFYIARAILPDRTPYYCFREIEAVRREMLASREQIYVEDFGTGTSGSRRVSDIAHSSLMPPSEAQLMMRLAVMLGAKEVLELGTSLGVTTSYLASAGKDVHVVTMEGAGEVRKLAMKNWQKLGLNNIDSRLGNIDALLTDFLPERPLDMVLLDANHTEEATLRYVDLILPHTTEKTIVVLDDIRYSREMYRAWQKVCAHPAVTGSMDLGQLGLAFFDPHFEKKTYRIRL